MEADRAVHPVMPESTLNMLRQACLNKGVEVGADGSVSEADAAWLLNGSQTLRSRRTTYDNAPLWRKPAGRYRYRLRDLANFLDQTG